MDQRDARSLQQIEQETEQTRADLLRTVEQLRSSVIETSQDVRERLRPAVIGSEVTKYVRSRRERWFERLKAAALENPLQAVAVASALAYPFVRVMRVVPAPVLMIGAGMYLAGSKSGKLATQRVASAAAGLREEATQRAKAAGDRLNETKADAGSRGTELQERTVQYTKAATEAVGNFADKAAAAGQRYAGAAKDTATEAARSARNTASDLSDSASKTITETIERNPLVVAGVGLVIGAVIASALPHTEVEDELMGETSRSVRRRAQAAGSRAFGAAKDAAGQGARRAARQAEQEGLDPDGVRDTVRDTGERVRRVAEAAVTTAFEPPEENGASDRQGESSSDRQGESSHG